MIGIALAVWNAGGQAQELEPGLYQNAPLRMNVAMAGYTYSAGNVVLDASLPIEGAHAKTHSVALVYLRTLGLFGHSAKVDVQIPMAWGDFEGTVAGVFRTRSPSGFADPRVRLSVNLLGAPALSRSEYAGYRQKTILGVSAQAVVPMGQYDAEKLVNLGTNRWAFRTEAGLSRTLTRWFLEASTGAWFFTKNSDYYGASSVTQQPLLFVKGDAIYTFKRGLWAAFSYGLANGGETSVNGAPAANLQTNNRVAATLALPIARATSLQLKYTSGVSTRLGADFDTYGAVLQYTWGS